MRASAPATCVLSALNLLAVEVHSCSAGSARVQFYRKYKTPNL